MILNEDYDFLRDAPPQVKNSFKGGYAVKGMLWPGERLYRYTTAGHNEPIGRDWMPKDTYAQFEDWSKRTGIPLPVIARNRLAITYECSKQIDRLCVVEPKRQVYGFAGPA